MKKIEANSPVKEAELDKSNALHPPELQCDYLHENEAPLSISILRTSLNLPKQKYIF